MRALAARGFQVEPSPWGKVIGKIQVYNEDVFAEPSRLLQFFNHFHYTTRESSIRGVVVINPGEVWDQEKVEESARVLRDPLWSSVVAVLPVVSQEPGKVDLLVVTRDIWSLRLNTQYTFQLGTLTNLSLAISENNFLGTRSVFAAGFTMDQGAIATGPIFINKNLLGLHLDFRARLDAILNRDALVEHGKFQREGSQSSISLTRSLWSLATEWGGGVSFSHRFAIDRQFLGLDLFPVDCSSGTCVRAPPPLAAAQTGATADFLGVQYEMRRWNVTASGVRQWGTDLKSQLTIGQAVTSQRPRLLDSFPGNDLDRAAFIRDVLPRSELSSGPFISYGVFTPTFKTLRNVSTYDLAEDTHTGPNADVSYSLGLKLLGSDNNFQRGSWSAGWAFPWCHDGIIHPAVGMSLRYQGGSLIDSTASTTVRVITPTFKWVRLVTLGTVATRFYDTQNAFFAIGSDAGLRGFTINEFRGLRLATGQLELRTIPRPLWVIRYGAVLFYDVGAAADTFKQMQLHSDVGIGVRMLVPQTSRELFRFDLAVPLDTTDRTKAGSLHFIAGFDSAF